LVASARPVSEIKRHVNNLILEDPHLRNLIPLEENVSANPLINNFKTQVLEDLYQLLEFVLLNNDQTYPQSKEVLEARLATILNPKNKGDAKLTQLKVIDQYLSDINAE